jgi:PAS domain S-box-containing protein
VIVVSRDVTKRKLAEEDLQASEERFRSVVQTANDAIVLADGSGQIVAWNSSAQRMFGYSESEVRGQHLTKLLPERYRERQEPGLVLPPANVPSRFIAIAIELHGLRKDGSEFPLELSISAWKNGGDMCYSAIFRDRTEDDRARQAFQELRRQSDMILNAAGEGICGLDHQSMITFANPAAARMLAYEPDQLIGQPFYEILRQRAPGTLAGVPQTSPVLATLRDGAVHRASDQVFWKKSGASLHVDCVSTPIKEGTQCRGAVVLFNDITHRRQAEEQLRAQAALLDNATDAICVVDTDSRIMYWNKGGERLYGWSIKEVMGKLSHEVLFQTDLYRPDEAFRTLIQTREWEGELVQLTKTGREIIVHSRWTLMHDSRGAPNSILIINSDITEKKGLETQFLRAQRLETVGRLATGIAHDLNNVLAPILMSAQLLAPKLKEDEDKRMLEVMRTSALRGADLLRQILSFSRGEGKTGAVNIKSLINEQLKILHQTFLPSVEIRCQAAKDLWQVTGNATQIFQVLMNLCVNARDAMPKGGALRLDAENVILDREYVKLHPKAKAGPHVLLTVSDSGVGIPPETIDQIFNPFFTSKSANKGTGLGLSTVLTIVTSHQGHLQVQSEAGKGTCFKVFLPALEKRVQPPEFATIPDVPHGSGQWILVVDNEETIREMVTFSLEHFGYKVLTASDGTEALARYAKYKDRIRLMIVDMVMPFMDGAALMRALRRMDPAAKILAVSGHVEGKRLAADAGVPFIEKPFSSEKLLVEVHKLVTGAGAKTKQRHAELANRTEPQASADLASVDEPAASPPGG